MLNEFIWESVILIFTRLLNSEQTYGSKLGGTCSHLFFLLITGALTYTIGVSPVISSKLPTSQGFVWKRAQLLSHQEWVCLLCSCCCPLPPGDVTFEDLSCVVVGVSLLIAAFCDAPWLSSKGGGVHSLTAKIAWACSALRLLKLPFLPLPWQKQVTDSKPLPLPNYWSPSHQEMRQLSKAF